MSGRSIFALAVALLAIAWGVLALNLERFVNRVDPVPLPTVSERARALHARSFVSDLHADSLLFGRDLRRRSNVGHSDLPRLREGGVALQFFTVVTQVPLGWNPTRTEAPGFELLTLIGCLRFEARCFSSPIERLAAQAEALQALVAADPALHAVTDRDSLRALRERRAQDPNALGALLGIEGAHALEDEPRNLERAFALGVRMIGLAHFFDNAYAGSAHGVEQGGLSELGRATLLRMEELGILVDLAHISARAFDEALDLVTKPPVISHGGAKGTCDNPRTRSDAQLRKLAARGGVIGLGFWAGAVCGTRPQAIARAARYVADLVGAEHVALGSDYDGAVRVGFDASQLPAVTQALLDEDFEPHEVRGILGGNLLRVLDETLP